MSFASRAVASTAPFASPPAGIAAPSPPTWLWLSPFVTSFAATAAASAASEIAAPAPPVCPWLFPLVTSFAATAAASAASVIAAPSPPT